MNDNLEQFLSQADKAESLTFVKQLMFNEMYRLCDLENIDKENFDTRNFVIPENLTREENKVKYDRYLFISGLCQHIDIIEKKLDGNSELSNYSNSTRITYGDVFKNTNKDNKGLFILHKSYFVIEGFNFPRAGRCDNFSYTGVAPTYKTEYEKEGVTIGNKSSSFTVEDPEIDNGLVWGQFLEVPGQFCFTYTEPVVKVNNSITENKNIEDGMNPAALLYGKSLIELLKIIREWSFLCDEPFNLDHPMAVHSKMVFDTLSPPQDILDEIDNLPDMHLARFLKSDAAHRERYDEFPQMSNGMMEWFMGKMQDYPKTTLAHKLENVIL